MGQFFVCLGCIIVFLLALTPFVIWDIKKRDKKIKEVFGGREKLNVEDFYEKYFKARGVPFYVVQKIREILERELDADLSALSAEDDFSKNLSFFWDFDSLAGVEIVIGIEEEFQIRLTEQNVKEQTYTIDEIVNMVWQKIQEKEIYP